MADVQLSVLERQLAELARELETAQSELARLDYQATEAQHALDLAEARAVLASKKPNAESRRAEATVVCESERWTAHVAAQKVRAAKSRIAVLNTRVDVGRSLLSAARQTWASAGVGAA